MIFTKQKRDLAADCAVLSLLLRIAFFLKFENDNSKCIMIVLEPSQRSTHNIFASCGSCGILVLMLISVSESNL